MEIVKLHLKILTDESNRVVEKVTSETVNINGLLLSLSLSPTRELYLECRAVDSQILCSCELEVPDYPLHRYPDQIFNFNKYTKNDENFQFLIRKQECSTNVCVFVHIKSFEIHPSYSFDFKDDKLTDITLIVGDKKLYCSKQILALNSEKFYEMIYNQKDEVDQIEIENVDYHVFHRFLEILYGYDYRPLNEDDLIKFTELSFHFKSKRCLERCETSYLKLRDFGMEAFEDNGNLGIEKLHLANADKKYRNNPVRRSSASEKSLSKLENGTTIIEIFNEEVPLKIETVISGDGKMFNIECLHHDGMDLWEFMAFFVNPNGRKNSHGIGIVLNAQQRTHTILLSKNKRNHTLKFTHFRNPYPVEHVDFSIPHDKLTDIVLSVDDKKFHVAKQILAGSSTYFYNMFYAGYREQYQTDIPLIGIDKDGFEEFLQHVYNPKRIVKASVLESLLESSNFYNAQNIHQKCINYILIDKKLNDAQKILLAVKYNLDDLFKKLTANIKTNEQFRAFSKLKGFEELDQETIDTIKNAIPKDNE